MERPTTTITLAAVLAVILCHPSRCQAAGAPMTTADRVRAAAGAYRDALNTTDHDQRLSRFALAEQLFRQLADGSETQPPVRNSTLLVNLGNAAMQAEHLGRAIAAYRAALDIDPRNAVAQQNLYHARSLVPQWARYERPDDWTDALFFWRSFWNRGQIIIIAAIACLLAAILIAISLIRGTMLWRNLAVVPAIVWLVLVVSILWDSTYLFGRSAGRDNIAVVVVDTVVRTADSENASRLSATPLPDGTEVQLQQQRERWSEVRLPDGRTGWVRNTALAGERGEVRGERGDTDGTDECR